MSADGHRVTVCMFPLGCTHTPVGEPHIHTTVPDASAKVIREVLDELARMEAGDLGELKRGYDAWIYKAAFAIRQAKLLKSEGAES